MNEGDIAAHDTSVGHRLQGTTVAAATSGHDVEALEQRQPHVGWT